MRYARERVDMIHDDPNHDTITMESPWGELVQVDNGIVDHVAALWAAGVRTSYSCQGDLLPAPTDNVVRDPDGLLWPYVKFHPSAGIVLPLPNAWPEYLVILEALGNGDDAGCVWRWCPTVHRDVLGIMRLGDYQLLLPVDDPAGWSPSHSQE